MNGIIGTTLIHLHSVDSTNISAAEILNWETLEEGTVITAFEQYAGRGQKNTRWESNPGENITMSTVIYPAFVNAAEMFCISEFVSLAIHEFLTEEVGECVHIKWPNDILVDSRKICGILIENALRGNSLSHSIIGIGLNLNQNDFNQYKPEAVSLSALTGKIYDRTNCIEKLSKKLDKYYALLKSGKQDLLHELYLNKLFRYKEKHPYEVRGAIIHACLEDVKKDGRLVLKNGSNTELFFDVKEVKFIY